MVTIADRMAKIPFSAIRSMFERVNLLEQQGQKVIHLDVGRPDFDTPSHIKAAATQSLNNGEVHYTSNYGIPLLREAITKKLKRDNQLNYSPQTEVIVTSGVSEGIMIAMMALMNPDDEVLVCEPLFPAYQMAARMAGAVVVTVPVSAENGYQPTREDLLSRLSTRTRMMIVTTPGNPTGLVTSKATLLMMANFAIKHDLIVMSDEIYEKLIYDGLQHISIASLPGMRERTLTLNGFSKSYAMTGWRVGYVAADARFIQAMIRIHQNSVVCANSFAQWGAVAALDGPQEPMEAMVREFDRRRLLMIEQLKQMSGLSFVRPQGAMYVLVDVSQQTSNAHQLADDLLQQALIAVVPWDNRHLRLSYGNSYANLQTALQRMGEFLVAEPE
ncbi:MAG: aminotransferase [Paraglaciecola sp.]|jgi:aspartate/methionine/tyrosine aminotransferase